MSTTSSCSTCGATFTSKTKLFRHLKTKQPDGSLSRCNQVAQDGGLKLNHIQTPRAPIVFSSSSLGHHEAPWEKLWNRTCHQELPATFLRAPVLSVLLMAQSQLRRLIVLSSHAPPFSLNQTLYLIQPINKVPFMSTESRDQSHITSIYASDATAERQRC